MLERSKYLLLCLPTSLVFSCGAISEPNSDKFADQAQENKAPIIVAVADWDEKPDGREWTIMAHSAIAEFGNGLLTSSPKDILQYCPEYNNLDKGDRSNFWVYVISKLARFESGHDPSGSFTEDFKDSKGNYIVSRGLLQLSIESANGYGCNIGDPNELHDPEENIRCAVRIMNRWVAERDMVVAEKVGANWRGAARYWSPFRKESRRAEIASSAKSQPYCT